MSTKIEWTDETWNPIRARNLKTGGIGHYCEKISPGCGNCYACALQPRFKNPIRYNAADKKLVEIFLDEKTLLKPLHWRKPRNIFPCSMTDLFGDWVPESWIDRIFAVMAMAKQHTFQILTKRSDRMQEMMSDEHERRRKIAGWAKGNFRKQVLAESVYLTNYPLPNVVLGVSVERDVEKFRIDDLLETPAVRRFISFEPILQDLGELDMVFPTHVCNGVDGAERHGNANKCNICGRFSGQKRGGIDQVIFGGESGGGARPCKVQWIRDGAAQTQAAGVKTFIKQLGKKALTDNPDDVPAHWIRKPEPGDFVYLPLQDAKGGDMTEWPKDLQIREEMAAI